MFLLIWIRATLLRFRYDQFMTLGRKWLVPIALVWLIAVAIVRGITAWVEISLPALGAVIVAVLGLIMLIMWITGKGKPERRPKPSDEEYTGFADGFPVPPLPGQTPIVSSRQGHNLIVVTPSKEGSDE